MICPNCKSSEGHYSNIEDFNPGSDPEWSYYECWTCYNCEHTLYSYEDGFIWEDEQMVLTDQPSCDTLLI